MNGTEAIIKKILDDAHEKAKEIEDNSVYNNSMLEKAYKDKAESFLRTQKAELSDQCAKLIERRQTLAELDKRKLLLQTKQEIINEVFECAYQKMCKLEKEKYLSLVISLIEKSAEEGDQILLSKDGVLVEKDLKEVLAQRNLSVCKEKGDFVGGIMLLGKNCDKDLTFSAVLEERKDQIVKIAVEQLFN